MTRENSFEPVIARETYHRIVKIDDGLVYTKHALGIREAANLKIIESNCQIHPIEKTKMWFPVCPVSDYIDPEPQPDPKWYEKVWKALVTIYDKLQTERLY